jgi:membrane fusion protein, multidrug efflux system
MTPIKVPMNRAMQYPQELGRWRRWRAMTDGGLKTKSDAGEPSFARTKSRHSPQLDRETPRQTEAPGGQKAAGTSPSRWRRPLLIAGPVALIVGALALYLATGRYVTEEDAYVQALNVSISPQVAGQVVAIAARSNTPVRRDNPLFDLDPEPYRIALANAEAQLGIARDQVRNLIETYRSRLKQIDEAKATVDYAQTNYDRQQHLFDTGAAPRATLDAAIRDLQSAKANLASLQRDAATARAQLGDNPDMPIDEQATVKQALAAVDNAARNLRLTSIVAPFDGIPNNVESIADERRSIRVSSRIDQRSLHRGQRREGNELAPASGSVFALLPPENATQARAWRTAQN